MKILFLTSLFTSFFSTALGPVTVTDTPICVEMPTGQSIEDALGAHNIPAAELLARSILAEGISTRFGAIDGCRDKGEAIFEAIGWGIMSRVQMTEHDRGAARNYLKENSRGIPGVIFKKGHFNPTTSEKSPFSQLFLCPEKIESLTLPDKGFGWLPKEKLEREQYWMWAKRAAEKIVNEPSTNPFAKRTTSGKIHLVSNFYYPHSVEATDVTGKWADPIKHKNVLVRDLKIGDVSLPGGPEACVNFFRHYGPVTIQDFRPEVTDAKSTGGR